MFVKTVNEMRVLISTSNFPVQIKSCASHLSRMCLYGGVYLASCSLWWRHKILFWFSSLIFQYHTCCSKGHFLCSIYLVRLMRFVFVFCFFLIAIVWLCWCLCVYFTQFYVVIFSLRGRLSFNQRYYSSHTKFSRQ